MPEANVLTPYEQEPHWLRNRRFRNTVKNIRPGRDGDTFRRGREKVVRANKGGAVVEGRPGDWGEVVTR